MGKIVYNYRQIANKIATSQAGAARINTIMQRKFELTKDHLIESFENHPVTQEIKEGAEADNISNTLNGYGNLWGYIGFPENGGDPTENVVDVINSDLKLINTSKGSSVSGDKIKLLFRYSMRIPRDALIAVTQLPWESGISWLYNIEFNGISGFGHYLAAKMNELSSRARPDKFNNPPSRSTAAIQTKNELRGGAFQTVLYWQTLIRNAVTYFKSL